MTRARPLTDLQVRVLKAIERLETFRGEPQTPDAIGHAAGAKRVEGGRGEGGRGGGHRAFGAAQQIIPTLTSLRGRGLIGMAGRRDGLSGTAYYITNEGREALDAQDHR